MKFQELNNEEILLIYLRQKKFMEVHEDLISQALHLSTYTGMLDETQELLVNNLEKMQTADHVVMLKKINKKLEPIVDLIYEADPSMYEKINSIVDTPLLGDEEDEFDDE
jgi:hypothetical protein